MSWISYSLLSTLFGRSKLLYNPPCRPPQPVSLKRKPHGKSLHSSQPRKTTHGESHGESPAPTAGGPAWKLDSFPSLPVDGGFSCQKNLQSSHVESSNFNTFTDSTVCANRTWAGYIALVRVIWSTCHAVPVLHALHVLHVLQASQTLQHTAVQLLTSHIKLHYLAFHGSTGHVMPVHGITHSHNITKHDMMHVQCKD